MAHPTGGPDLEALAAQGANNFLTLQTYDAGRACRKCGSTQHQARWCQGNNLDSRCLGIAGPFPHLHVICEGCHHVRIEKTLDPDDQETP